MRRTTSRSTPPRTRRVFSDDVAGPLRRRGLPVDHGRPAQRRPAGGVRALHPRWRRLRRHPRRGRHRVRVDLVRQAGGRVLPQPPARHADARRSASRTPITTPRWACRTRGRAWTSGTTTSARGRRSVGGGGTDWSPRLAGVHVLATVDESTYDEDDGNTTDDDHPISWCQRYDGGRSWYTGMGHTAASFGEAPLPQAPARRPRGRGRRGRGRRLRRAGPATAPPTVTAQRNPSRRRPARATRWPSRRRAPIRTATRSPTSGTSATAAPRPPRTRCTPTTRSASATPR